MGASAADRAKATKNDAAAPRSGRLAGIKNYWKRSRGFAVSFLAIAPLLLFYEFGLWLSSAEQVNGAEAILRRLFLLFGDEYGPMLWRAALGCAFGIAFFVALKQRAPIYRDVPFIAAEGLAFGAILGPVALALQKKLDAFLMIGPAVDPRLKERLLQITLSVGAGVYEEILFRFILLSAVFYVASRGSAAAGASGFGAAATAVILSSLAFSIFHYWPAGEAFEWRSFIFRAVAGGVLGVIFILRGLGVAAYAHAAYDILVTLAI